MDKRFADVDAFNTEPIVEIGDRAADPQNVDDVAAGQAKRINHALQHVLRQHIQLGDEHEFSAF